jgi:hypothetical protein
MRKRKIPKQQVSFSVNIPYEQLSEAMEEARRIMESDFTSPEQIVCEFTMDASHNTHFVQVARADRKDKLKDCFGGYRGDAVCDACFLAKACELVCKGCDEEERSKEEGSVMDDIFGDLLEAAEEMTSKKKKKMTRKASIKSPFSLEKVSPPTPAPEITVDAAKEKSTSILSSLPSAKSGKGIVWRRAAKTDNLCGTAIFELKPVAITIFPSKYKEEKFTLCINQDGEKPEFKDGFESEEEAQKFVEALFKYA